MLARNTKPSEKNQYDHRNRLVEITEAPNLQAALDFDLKYEYDAFDRRVSRAKTVTVDGGEGNDDISVVDTEKFIYDGDHVVLDFYKPNGGAFSLQHRYLYGPAVDQVLAQENITSVSTPGTVLWMLTDNLGTVHDIVNNSGSIVTGGHFKYDAYGNILSGDKTLTRYLYTAREYDATTGLQYNRERWYDPRTGRWLSEDPISFAGGDYNLYRYVGNSPTNFVDPSGLDGESPTFPNYGQQQDFAAAANWMIDYGREANSAELNWMIDHPAAAPPRVIAVRRYDGHLVGDIPRSAGPALTRFVNTTDNWFLAGVAQFIQPVVSALGWLEGARIDFLLPPSGPSYKKKYDDGSVVYEPSAGPDNDALMSQGMAAMPAFGPARAAIAPSSNLAQVTINRQTGLTFQQEVTSALGAQRAGRMTGTTLSGAPYTTVPDGIMRNGGLLEAKAGQYISYSPQLQAQVNIGRAKRRTVNDCCRAEFDREQKRPEKLRATECSAVRSRDRKDFALLIFSMIYCEECSMLSAGCLFRGNYMLRRRAEKVVRNVFCAVPELRPQVWDFVEPARRPFEVNHVVDALAAPEPGAPSTKPFFLRKAQPSFSASVMFNNGPASCPCHNRLDIDFESPWERAKEELPHLISNVLAPESPDYGYVADASKRDEERFSELSAPYTPEELKIWALRAPPFLPSPRAGRKDESPAGWFHPIPDFMPGPRGFLWDVVWFNYFGLPYLELIGKQRLKAAGWARFEEVGDGLACYATERIDDPESFDRRSRLREALSEFVWTP